MIKLPANIAIFGDIHLRHDVVENELRDNSFDKIYFLGDYFDSFDSKLSTKATAKWLQESVDIPNRVHLMGNHDVHYWPNCRDEYKCSGYTNSKRDKIQKYFNKWDKLLMFEKVGNALLSHAGLGNIYAKKVIDNNIDVFEWLEKEAEYFKTTIDSFDQHPEHWFENWGTLRGGYWNQGGLLTMDVREYKAISLSDGSYLCQIFGHTPIFNGPFYEHEFICLDNFKGVGFLHTDQAGEIILKSLGSIS